jgi:hypothetical protein
MATFETIREKFQKAQAEQQRELEQERKLMTPVKKDRIYGSDPLVKPRREKSIKPDKWIMTSYYCGCVHTV